MITYGGLPQGAAPAIAVAAGERLRIVNHLGQQIADTRIFVDAGCREYLSMEHCRDRLYKLFFEPGDVLISNLRRPLARVPQDTSPGRHYTLCAACDAQSYAAQGLGKDYPNCRGNLLRLLESRGVAELIVPWP